MKMYAYLNMQISVELNTMCFFYNENKYYLSLTGILLQDIIINLCNIFYLYIHTYLSFSALK